MLKEEFLNRLKEASKYTNKECGVCPANFLYDVLPEFYKEYTTCAGRFLTFIKENFDEAILKRCINVMKKNQFQEIALPEFRFKEFYGILNSEGYEIE